MTYFRYITLLACALPLLFLVSCSNGNVVGSSLTASSGLEISTPEYLQDKTQKLLGIHEWKCNVTLPVNSTMTKYNLELHERGKKPRSIAGVGVGNAPHERNRELAIALDPSNTNWFQANEMKVVMHSVGSGGSSVIDNPFKNATSLQAHEKPVQLADGGFILLTGNRNKRYFKSGDTGEDAQHDLMLVFKVEAN